MLLDYWVATNSKLYDPAFLSPTKFRQAAEHLNEIGFSIAFREYNSGVLAIQPRNQAMDANGKVLLNWFMGIHKMPVDRDTVEQNRMNRGTTVIELAGHFGWTLSYTSDILELLEQNGNLCRDLNEGEVMFWRNLFFELA